MLEKVQAIMNKISSNKYLKAISNAMIGLLPITMIGSIASILVTLPINAWLEFIAVSGLKETLTIAVDFTINFSAVYIVYFVGRSIAIQFEHEKDASVIGVLSVFSFLLLTPITTVGEGFAAQSMIPFEYLGAKGIFSAMLIGVVVAKMFIFITDKNIKIKLPSSVPPMIGKSFEAIIPAIIIGATIMFIQFILFQTQYGTLHNVMYSLIQAPLSGLGSNFFSLLIASILMPLLWFFGLHGTSIFVAVLKPILFPLDVANLAAFTAGEVMPNLFGFNFWMIFTSVQMVFGLVVMMCFAKSKRYKTLGRMSIVPAFFGITEPVIFGTPLVMNFRFFIPYILSSAISVTIAYFATVSGLIPPCNGTAFVLGIPPVFKALMQGSWKIMALLIFNFAITSFLWIPGFRAADKEAYEEEQGVEHA